MTENWADNLEDFTRFSCRVEDEPRERQRFKMVEPDGTVHEYTVLPCIQSMESAIHRITLQ